MRLYNLLLAAVPASALVILPGGDPKPYTGEVAIASEEAFFKQSAPNEFFNNTAKVIMTSLSATNMSTSSDLQPSGDSFIRGAIQAWGEHLHLVIRPEEVWFTILVQMNFYMISHSEEIRSLFVNHTGQQDIYIEDHSWYGVLIRFQTEIQKRINTDWLLNWITPNFTTTTDSDRMIANILMMGLTKTYFKFTGKLVCGLPSITLLGELSDWEKLIAKLDRLPDFGSEPADYRTRLRPILSRFVASFKDPDSAATRTFWNQIVSAKASHLCGAPPAYVSGWITGFYYWNPTGGPYARGGSDMLTLDGVSYPRIDLSDAPIGYATAPFTMVDFQGEREFPAYVAAGTLGKQITPGPPEGYGEALKRTGGNVSLADDEARHGTLKPMSGWMLYGPRDHNATRSSHWIAEDELVDVQRSVLKYMQGETCGLVGN